MIGKCLMIIKLASHASNSILKNVIEKAGISRTCWMDLEDFFVRNFKSIFIAFFVNHELYQIYSHILQLWNLLG